MWVQAQDGNLVNVNQMDWIGVDKENNRSVVGIVGKNKYLIGAYDGTGEAREAIKEILAAIRQNVKVHTVS